MTEEPLAPLREHEARNREYWDTRSADYQESHGSQLAVHGDAWGIWQIPEYELRILGDVQGRDVIELGCGAAQWSIALARRGARPVGVDLSEAQLTHGRRLMAAAGVEFPLVHASAESVPLPDESFDIAFCDHGAFTFADPYRTVSEAARLIRDGGLLAFNMSTPLVEICWPPGAEDVTDRLSMDYFDLREVETGEADHVEFNLPYGDWIRLFRRNGFVVEDLVELRPSADATSTYRSERAREWARRWPMEHIWKVRRLPRGS
ncbi:MAG: class I SAM-dependent methyltransferase [Chloroflexota bacterium]|nr:class I SAM-dependent methyltransferase [Chloroflexota bacterium]